MHLIGLSELKGSRTDRLQQLRCADRNWSIWAHDQTGFLVSRNRFPDFKPVASSWTFTAAELNDTTICIAVYFPPRNSPRWEENNSDVWSELEKIFEILVAFPEHSIAIGGDFNIRQDIPNSYWNRLIERMRKFHLFHSILPQGSATYYGPGGNSCVDHIFVSEELPQHSLVLDVRQQRGVSTDHLMVIVTPLLVEPSERPLESKRFDLKRFVHLSKKLMNANNFETFHNKLVECYDKAHCPVQTPSTDLSLMVSRLRALLKSQSSNVKHKIRSLRRRIRVSQRKIFLQESDRVRRLFATGRLNSRSSWREVKSLLTLNPMPCRISRLQDSKDPVIIAGILARHFEGCFAAVPLPDNYEAPTQMEDLDDFPSVCFSLPTVRSCLTKLKKHKAPGPDGLPYEVYKSLPIQVLRHFAELLKHQYEEMQYPRHWLEGSLIPVAKPGLPSTEPRSYRPIALQSTDLKILERLALQSFTSHLDGNSVLSESQAGFRYGRGTREQIWTLSTILSISNTPPLSNSLSLYVAFLDVAKAFDTVHHQILIDKLVALRLPPELLLLIRSILTQSKRKVTISGDQAESDWFGLGAGVPQGSLLSPTLYTIFIDDVLRALEQQPEKGWFVRQTDELVFAICSLAFADDIAVLSRTETGLQHLLDICTRMGPELAFRWNADKSFVLVSGQRRRRNLQFLLDGKALRIVDEFRYLGSIVCRDGSWTKQLEASINACRAKSAYVSAQLKQLASASCFTAITLWKSLCRPVLEYGLESAVLSDADLDRLDQVQYEFFRNALQLPNQTPRCFVFASLGLRPMGERLERLRVGLAFDILHKMDNDRIPKRLFRFIQNRQWDSQLPWFQALYATLAKLGSDVDIMKCQVSDPKQPGKMLHGGEARVELRRRVGRWWDHKLRQELAARSGKPGHFLDIHKPLSRRTSMKFLQIFKRAHELACTESDIRGLTSFLRLRIGYNELSCSFHTTHFGAAWTRRCDRCRTADETPVHFFWECEKYREIRDRFISLMRRLFEKRQSEVQFDALMEKESSFVMTSILRLDGEQPLSELSLEDQATLCLLTARYIGQLFRIRGSRFH